MAIAGGIGSVAHAAGNRLYLTPSSQSVTTGGTFTVSLRVSPATPIDTVNAYVGYNASQLSLQSINCSGSPLSPFPSCPTSGNPVNISSADFGSTISSDSQVAVFTFKVLAGSGSSSLTLSGDTATNGTSDGATSSGASVTVTAATCPSGQTGTPPNCTTPPTGGSGSGGSTSGGSSSAGGSSAASGGSSSASKPSKSSSGSTKGSTPAPKQVSGPLTLAQPTILFTQAVFSATSTSPTQIYMQYGTSKDALTSQTPVTGFATTHQLTLDAKTLAPGQTYYYVIVSKTQQGQVTQTAVQSFTTKGLTIKVGVFDKNHKPLRNKTVTLHSTPYTAKTDANGYATFSNITAGTHHLTYSEGSQTYSETISVLNNVQTSGDVQTAPIQNVSVVLPLSQRGSFGVAWWPYIVIIVVIAAGVWLYLNRTKLRREFAHEPVLTSGQTIITSEQARKDPPATTISVSQPGADAPQAHEEKLANIPEPDKPAPGSMVAPDNNDNRESQHDGHESGGI